MSSRNANMKIASLINNENGEGARPKQNAPAPVTPIQTVPPPGQSFRDYSHSSQASPGPGKHGSQSQEYGSQNGGPYASPTTYQGFHPGRPPPPPPIQALPPNDLRSPAGSYSASSPYRHTPTSSISAAGGQYPFPSNLQNPQSPAQHQQYPPTFPRRESYSQPSAPSHLQHHNSIQIQGSPAPQTPPIGIPGAPHPYLQHQRSQSSLSNSTPTSAHSQQQPYPNQFTQDSPISTNQYPPNQFPPQHQHQRQQSQQSQPGTALGPPLQTQRQPSGGFAQPTSPYQQRGVSASPFTQYNQTSPAPPPASIPPRMPTTPRSAYDSQRTSLSSTQQRSISERERSLSVSPKTRLPSQTRMDSIPQHQPDEYNSSVKRKMEDRELPVEAPVRAVQHDVKPQVNGEHSITPVAAPSPQQPPKKRVRYTEPPIWARSARGMKMATRKTNGQPLVGQPPMHAPATLIKEESNGLRQSSPAVPRAAPPEEVSWDGPLGPWEPSITGIKPAEEMTRLVADWLFGNVVSRNDIGELASRGVEVEIEAKLGQLIQKDTGTRMHLPIQSEVVLLESNLTTFKSSMTESQHKVLNDQLNSQVTRAHPNNQAAKRRVKIDYLHRRETDKFYELPSSMHATLPPALRSILNPRHTVKVRVTHDQKTNQILAKIVKARVTDLDIYFPLQPLDCRISINLEMRWDGDLEELIANNDGAPRPDRNKDRLSYTQSHYQIDLTQVTQTLATNGGMPRVEKEHELEVELSTAALREQGMRAARNEPNGYLKLVEGFIDNVRVLARNVPPPARE